VIKIPRRTSTYKYAHQQRYLRIKELNLKKIKIKGVDIDV